MSTQTSQNFDFLDSQLDARLRIKRFVLFLLGTIWILMSLYTTLTFLREFVINQTPLIFLAYVFPLLIVYTQSLIGIGCLGRYRWVMVVVAIHILVSLFMTLAVLPVVGLTALIAPTLVALVSSYLPLFVVLFLLRSELREPLNQPLIIWSYFLSICIIGTLHIVSQVLIN